ncbi:Cytokinin dehydrogenase [Castilleja foliolosa]|uniref:cytokinin dehydrogenase n=1 Tax=Castilleja foliolosa TaxID=1961234 RepID=A0ABD3C0S8_9LAMI
MANLTPHISSFFLLTISIIIVANPWPHTTADSYITRLHNDTFSLIEASKDYGNIVHDFPFFVLQPSSVEDIINLTRSSPAKTIAAKGHGHSLRGQAMALNGVVVNMTTLCNTGEIVIGGDKSSGHNYVDVGGGQLWIDVLNATLKYGMAPRSWTDYLHLTVGGTLSNAGISGQSFLYGPQINNVLQLEVVTGTGQLMNCSANENPTLFEGVLGGLGQFGIITKARIVVDTAPKRVKWARLIYNDFNSFTKDQEYLISTNAPITSYVEGFLIINASTTAFQWSPQFTISDPQQSLITQLLNNQSILYSIELAIYYNDDNQTVASNQFESLHNSLSFTKGLNFSIDAPFFDFIYRVGDLDVPEKGSLLSHPWLNLFIPKSNIFDFNKLVLAGMLPRLNQTSGLFIFYPMNKNKWDDKMSAITPDLTAADEGVFYTLGLLHSSQPSGYEFFDKFNNEVLDVCEKAGIKLKQYLPNYKTNEEWRTHFGIKWNDFNKKKSMFDPNNILSPGQAIFIN